MSVRLPKLTTFVRHGSFNGPDGPVTYVAQCDIVDASDSLKRYGSVTCGRGHTIDKEEQIARLWAVAPEMAEAVERFFQYVTWDRTDLGIEFCRIPTMVLKQMADALTKARGEAQ